MSPLYFESISIYTKAVYDCTLVKCTLGIVPHLDQCGECVKVGDPPKHDLAVINIAEILSAGILSVAGTFQIFENLAQIL